MTYGWLVGIVAAIAGALTASMKVHKWGPWNTEMDETAQLDLRPASPETSDLPSPTPTGLKQPVSGLQTPNLRQFCTALRDFEGLPGDANYKNNNPGNCRFNYAGYLPIYEPVKCSPNGFAIFKDYATGWLYLTNMVKQIFHNHPDWTILDFFSHYAPASDHNPVSSYAAFVAKRLGVDISFKVKDIVLG